MSESTVLAPAAKLRTIIKININTANAQKRCKDNMCILVQAVGAAVTVGCLANPSVPTDRHSEARHARQSADH